MKRIVLIFGLISGVITSAMMFLTLPLLHNDKINFANGEVIGYSSILLSMLLVFFGIRSYRENHGGTVSFGRAFTVGILITIISCLFYVASWEIIYFKFMPDFAEKYEKSVVASMRAKGASEAEIAEEQKKTVALKALLDNPLTNAAMTFIEPFPVGLIVTLISAAVLRRRAAPVPAASPAVT